MLLIATVVALIWANAPFSASYFNLQQTELGLIIGEREMGMSLHEWVNNGLMTLFFLHIGLQIKREVTVGLLSSWQQALLPVVAALGGMIAPALIYTALNAGQGATQGWGIPIATDIAFALGVLALLHNRVPAGLKVFVAAFAVADDMGAVLVIALFYSGDVQLLALAGAVALLGLLALLSYWSVSHTGVFILLSIGVWVLLISAGVHGTVTGVLIALIIPARIRLDPEEYIEREEALLDQLARIEATRESLLTDDKQLRAVNRLYDLSEALEPPLSYVDRYLSPLVNLGVLPVFALFNAGVALDGSALQHIGSPVSAGIILGLFFGKQIGIMLSTWLIVRFGPVKLPEAVGWWQIYGVSCLAGIGFTMALFITDLTFESPQATGQARIAILLVSLLAGTVGFFVTRWSSRPDKQPGQQGGTATAEG